MKLKEILNEMGKELLPSLSAKEDKKALSQLRKLYRKDLVQFEDKLKRINTIRRAEGLQPIYKEEVIGKSLKQDITTAIEKETNKKIKSKVALDLSSKKNIKFYYFENENKEFKNTISSSILSFGKKIGEITFKHKDVPSNRNIKDYFSPRRMTISIKADIPFKIINKSYPFEVRFPTLNKKLFYVECNYANEIDLKIEKI